MRRVKFLIFALILSVSGFLIWFVSSLAYEPIPTHSALAEKSARLFNQYYQGNLSEEEIQEIIQGAIKEDIPPRWINHFYDPTTGQGWTGERMGQLPASLVRQFALIGLSSAEAVSTLNWVHNQKLQDRYLNYQGNRTFEKAVYDYVQGNKKQAYRSLGHILHLIEDMAVPAHTRQDTHYDGLGDPGEPYEKWVKENTNLSHLANLNPLQEDFHCSDLDDCLKKIARYSNENFFSEDTILDEGYSQPIVKDYLMLNGQKYAIGEDSDGGRTFLFVKAKKDSKKEFTVDDLLIHRAYWQRLSKKAVLAGLEVIRIFQEEVAKAEKDQSLLEPPPVSSANYYRRLLTGAPAIFAPQAEMPVVSIYGGIVQLTETFKKAVNFITGLFRKDSHQFQQANISSRFSSKELESVSQISQESSEDLEEAASSVSEPVEKISPSKESTPDKEEKPTAPELIPELIQEQKEEVPTGVEAFSFDKSDKSGRSEPKTIEPKSTPGPKTTTKEELKPKKEESAKEEKETEQNQPIVQSGPPLGLPFFIGGGSPVEAETETETTISTFISPPKIISPSSGTLLGQSDDFSTSTDGFQINLVGTSTPDYSILIFINSTSTIPDYSTITDSQGNWQQIITLQEGENAIKVKAKDIEGHQSQETSLSLIVDTTPPSKIIDLSVSPSSQRGQISLSWTAPGDDESIGTSTEYIIRYATSSEITTANWDSAIDITSEPMPSIASTTENLTVSNLTPGQTYYFAIQAQDEAGNLSEISNCASSSPSAQAENLVISELMVQGEGGANDEFIELYNPTNQVVDLSGWSIQYRGSQAETFQKKNFVSGNSIPAHGYFLIANSSYDGHMIADMSHNSFQLSAKGGTVFLVNNQTLLTSATSSSIIDKLAYGSGSYLFPEGTEFSSVPPLEQSLERKATATSTAQSLAVNGNHHWQGNSWDTDNNSQDFVLQTQPNPQNSLSLNEPGTTFPVLADAPWPMFQHDVQHTGRNSYFGSATGTPTSTPKWIVSLGSNNPTSPVIAADGSIYIGAASGKLYKVNVNNATGTVELFYDTQTDGNVQTPAIASDGTIYISDNKHYVYALSAAGQLKWKYPINDGSSPTIASDGTIYIGSKYYLYALTPNGELIWQSPQLSNGRWVKSPVLASDGTIYTVGKIGSDIGNRLVYALDFQNGSIIWKSASSTFSTAPTLSDNGTIIVGSKSGLYALNSSDGSEKWRISIGEINNSMPAIDSNGIIYIGSQDYHLYAIDSEGNSQWPYDTANTQGKIYASPVVDVAGVIYIGSESKMFYAFNPDGSVKWQYELSSPIKSSAVIGSDGTVYVVSNDGSLYAFGG